MIPYEARFGQDRRWAMDEGDRHFGRDSDTFRAMRRTARVLGDLDIPYAVIGALACFHHGFRRFTTDVDLLITPDGLRAIHDRAEALGYVRPVSDRHSIREVETGVRIDLVVTGAYPGDGRPKPVAFPDPAKVGEVDDGVVFANLPTLVELMLAASASGNLHYLKDRVNVVELIKALKLPAALADRLNPHVRDDYLGLWAELQELEREP